MWIDKLSGGVLRVLTPIGSRYIQPSLPQRFYLLWIFRNFPILPQQVLSRRQQRLIDALCAEHRFVSLTHGTELDVPIIGTVERRPPVLVEPLPVKRHTVRITEAPLADLRQQP
jgi:hypothetical protein